MNQLIKNCTILTMDELNPKANAALIVGERFAHVGDYAEVIKYANDKNLTYKELDLAGKTVVPGFNDAHLHFLHYVKAKRSVNLFDAKALSEVMKRMTDATKKHEADNPLWLVGEGWNQDYFEDEKRFPTKQDLDAISSDIPIIIMRACFHIGVLNSKALEIMKPLWQSLDPKLAIELFDRDAAGEPTGIVRESLFDDIKSQMPAPSIDFLLQELLDSQEDLFRQGITSIQSDDVKYTPGEQYVEFFTKLGLAAQEGKLKLRYGLQLLADDKESLEALLATNLSDLRMGRLRFNCVKLLADGSLGARTAYLSQPYHDDPENQGIAMFSDETLTELIELAHVKNLPTAVHAIGNGAMEQVLSAIETVQEKHPHLTPRHGIVHAQITDKAILQRVKDLNVSIFAQPIFISYDMHMVHDRVGDDLAETSYAWKSMVGLGIPMALSTDSPVEPFDTMPNLYTAVSRLDLSGRGPYLPQEALSLEQAIYGYTAASAYVEQQEMDKGKISPGQLADFVVTEENLLDLPAKDLLRAKVYETYISGERVYRLE